MHKPSYRELAAKAGISIGYAWEIVEGDRDIPWRTAIHIYRTTGWRAPSIADWTEEKIDLAESLEPWVPRKKSAA